MLLFCFTLRLMSKFWTAGCFQHFHIFGRINDCNSNNSVLEIMNTNNAYPTKSLLLINRLIVYKVSDTPCPSAQGDVFLMFCLNISRNCGSIY